MSGRRNTCLAVGLNLPIVTRSRGLVVGFLWLACALPMIPTAVGASRQPTTQPDADPMPTAKTDVDAKIRELMGRYETRIAALDPTNAVVAANLPRLRENVALLRSEIGQDKSRYPVDCFTAEQCIDWLERDMKFYLDDCLEKGTDPRTRVAGRWLPKAYWIERADIMGRYDLLVPRAYDPKRSWPLVISYQDNPDQDLIRQTPYILLRAVQKGYPKSLVRLENKTRSMLKDAMRELNIDPYRIYATGFSFGGRTCLMFAWRYPHWFAAIAPVCNDLRGPETPRVRYLKNVPSLLLHGDRDSFLKTGRQVYAYLTDADCPAVFQTYPGGHNPVPFRKDVKVLTDFFDRHVMDPYPKRVSHIVEHKRYSRAFWVDAKLIKDAGGMAGAFEVRVGDANRVEIDANEQIAELDLYLDSRLVDMGKPVTVVSGDKVLYSGPAVEKLTVTLREAPDYARDSGDMLWRDLVRIHDQVHGAPSTQPISGKGVE